MIALLAAAALMIEPAPHTDRALSCTDPGYGTPYRIPAQWMDEMGLKASFSQVPLGSQYRNLLIPGWIFVHRLNATCHEVEDHQSHYSKYFGNRHHHRE